MKKKEMTVWYAVSRSGQGHVFTTKPERSDAFGIWVGEQQGFISSLLMYMESDGLSIPQMKWSDEPLTITLTVSL